MNGLNRSNKNVVLLTYFIYACVGIFLAYYEGDLVHLSMVISFIDRMNEA